jgi:SnoaL-like domain
MDDIRKLTAEHGATRALIAHWAALDSGNFEAVANGIAGDGVWHRQGKELKGPAMVRAAMAERSKGARTRHVVTNMLTTLKSETEAEIDFYMTVFSHTGEADAPPPAPMNLPNTVGLSRATLRRDGSQWKIAYLKSAPTFQRK